jgi:hypothetical protein
MSTAVMVEPITEASPRLKARIAGVFYLLNFLTGGVAFFASGRIVVSGDAVATATNILAHEPLFRLGFTVYLIVVSSYIAVTGLFYSLFKPVNRSLLWWRRSSALSDAPFWVLAASFISLLRSSWEARTT